MKPSRNLFFRETPFLLHEYFYEGGISGINEILEDYFNFKLKQIIKRSVIFNNQTERI